MDLRNSFIDDRDVAKQISDIDPVIIFKKYGRSELRQDRMGMEIVTLNELYAATDQVGIRALERIDGDIALPEAFACLKTKASA